MHVDFRPGVAGAIGGLLDRLDVLAERADVEGPPGCKRDAWVSQRRNRRYAFRCDCVVRYFTMPGRDVVSLPGRTRNLSRSGVAFVARRPCSPEEIVEVELLRRPAGTPRYLAGRVRFTRYVGKGYYEVGVALYAAADTAPVSGDPLVAFKTLDWVREGMQSS